MQHLEINPYTPGQVCIDINSKNSEKSIMKNLFNYFNKKQQKLNNSFNKIINTQSQANKQQRLTIYAPMLEGLTTCKRDAISSVDCPSRKNFIQQNKNFVVKKNRPMTTNPSNRQQNNQQIHLKQNNKSSKFIFQELPNIEIGGKNSNNTSYIYSQQNDQPNQLNISYIKSDGLSQLSKELPNIDQISQQTPNMGQAKQKQQRLYIKKSVANSLVNQGLNNSFDNFQSRKNSLNRKILYCNNSINNQTLQTQGVLDTQADETTIQATCNQGKNTNSQTIGSNIDHVQFTQMMNQTIAEQQQTLDQQRQIKTHSDNCHTEESDVRFHLNYKNNTIQNMNDHFCSKSTHFQHSISTQNNEYITTQKNGEGTTIDTLINVNLTQGNEYQQSTNQNEKGVEKISILLMEQQQYQQDTQGDLSVDQKLIDASYKNLLNERPPFINRKQRQTRSKVRSSCNLTEGQSISKELSKYSSKHNNSFQEITELQKDHMTSSQRNRIHSVQSTQNSTNRVKNAKSKNNNLQLNQQDIESGRILPQEKSEMYTFNNMLSERIDDFLSHQQTQRENQEVKEILPIRADQVFTQGSQDKKEKDGQFQRTIEEDIENNFTIEEINGETIDHKQNEKQSEIYPIVSQQAQIKQGENIKDPFQNGDVQKSIRTEELEKNQKTPQKMLNTNVSSLQNSLQKLQMRSNHITFNVMSNTKDYFDQQSNYLQQNLSFVGNQQISDQKFITSSFDGRNQSFVEAQIDHEMKASRQFNEMKEYIQSQIDSNKQVINQYHQINSTKKLQRSEIQSQNHSQQIEIINPLINEDQIQKENKQSIHISRPISSKRPLTGIKKANIQKNFNFYDELDKKLEEKKKNIVNFQETNLFEIEAQPPIEQQQITFNNNRTKNSAQNTNRGFNSGRNNSLQINSQNNTQKPAISQRRKSSQDTSRINMSNLVLNESKMHNFNINDVKEQPQKVPNCGFVLVESNQCSQQNENYQQYQVEEIQKQSIHQDKNHYNKPISEQIYYQQFLQNHPTKDQPVINSHNDNQTVLMSNNYNNNVNKVARPPSNYYNNNNNSNIRQQHQSFNNNPKTQQIPLQQNNQLQQSHIDQDLSYQQQGKNEQSDFGYDIPSHSRITRKQRASTMENTYQLQKGKENVHAQYYSSERQSLLNSSRKANMSSNAQLNKEQQLDIIKKVQEQQKNRQKLHSYLQQNQFVHDNMKHASGTMHRNNSSISQQIQNQINNTLQNCSSNNLGLMCNTQQTSQMNLNTQIFSTQKKSINPLVSLQNTQEFLQSMKLVNNPQHVYGEDINTSQKKYNQQRFQSAHSSAHRQNPLLQSDQSQFISQAIAIQPFNNNEIDQFKNLTGELNMNQQYFQTSSQHPFNQVTKLNMAAIPQPTEEDTSFSRRKKSVNPLYNLTEQKQAIKTSIDLKTNNVQFYENLNNSTIKENDIDIDSRVYANHQYQYALKRQQRKEDQQLLQQSMGNAMHNNNNNNHLNQSRQLKQLLQQQNVLIAGQKQIVNKSQQNTFGVKQNQQNKQLPFTNQYNISHNNQQQPVHNYNQINHNKRTNISQKEKENIPSLQNYQYLDTSIIIDSCSQIRGRQQASSKTSQRYNIQLNEDIDDKTLEYSGSKAGAEIYY